MRGMARGYGTCMLFVAVGAILGGILGELMRKIDALSGLVPYLVQTYPVLNLPMVTINLYVIQFSFGFVFEPNIMSVLGVVLAIVLFRKY